MSADPMVTVLNSLYLVPMAVISVVGTAALFKLLAALAPRRSAHRTTPAFLEPVDA